MNAQGYERPSLDQLVRMGEHGVTLEYVRELKAQGYNVQINWVGGYSNVSLSECKVTAIHNPDGTPTSQNPLATVYVDISCPSNNFD